MIETYYEAAVSPETPATRTKFRIVLPATSMSNGIEGRSGKWEIALRRVFQSVAIDMATRYRYAARSEERIVMLINLKVER